MQNVTPKDLCFQKQFDSWCVTQPIYDPLFIYKGSEIGWVHKANIYESIQNAWIRADPNPPHG